MRPVPFLFVHQPIAWDLPLTPVSLFPSHSVAALKCRQRKKQWLANLQAKVEIFGSENDALSAQVTQLREEIVNLKTLLLAHKDCPVSQAQGMAGMSVGGLGGDYAAHGHANPYAMAMANAGQVMAGRGVPRR